MTYLRALASFLVFLTKSRGYLEFGADDDGTVEYWGRRQLWGLRPRFLGLLKERDCGCSYRLGRRVLTLWGCESHMPRTWGDDE